MPVGAAGTVLALVCAHGRSTPYNNYVLFAQALLHGRLWIDWPGPYIDAVLFDGHRYIVNDPVPALLLLPFVALFGNANQTLLACVLAGVASAAAWTLCRRLGASRIAAGWLTAFALLGTDLVWSAMLGDVWFVAQTSAFAFLTLTLVELAGARRGWLVALLFALAVGSRFTVVMALPVVLYWAGFGLDGATPRLRAARGTALALVPFALVWVAYNLARWHVPWDSGHTIFYHQDGIGSPTGSPFGLHNVPMQLWSFFVQAPLPVDGYPYLKPDFGGQALTWTSPALAFALFARGPRALIAGAWIATALVAAPSLLYYVNGFAQFGMRHALDFEPFLLALMARAALPRLTLLYRAAIVWSVAVGAWGIWFWNAFYRQQN